MPNSALPGEFYAEAAYECESGHHFDPPDIRVVFCAEGEWVGKRPRCVPTDGAGEENKEGGCSEEDAARCDQTCRLERNEPTCGCQSGYTLMDDGSTCVDVDECAEGNESVCGELGVCVNRPGTFLCECPAGYTGDGVGCADVNECLLNNGHGPCQDRCRNTQGSYSCSCEGLPGTSLSEDKHTCEEMRGCSDGRNGGCSHTCVDSYNQVGDFHT